MSGQTKQWWLEDTSLRKLDGPMRRQLAKRNRSAIGVLAGLGVRAEPTSETVPVASPPRAPVYRPAQAPDTRVVTPLQPELLPERPLPGRFLLALGRSLRSTARAQGRDVGSVVGDELQRVATILRVLAWATLLAWYATHLQF